MVAEVERSVVVPSAIPVVVGSKAIAGALVRMSADSNRPCKFHGPSSPVSFTNWGDWDNGHTDG
jgi:small neutral amino acid transporter SnatA (MarC family)